MHASIRSIIKLRAFHDGRINEQKKHIESNWMPSNGILAHFYSFSLRFIPMIWRLQTHSVCICVSVYLSKSSTRLLLSTQQLDPIFNIHTKKKYSKSKFFVLAFKMLFIIRNFALKFIFMKRVNKIYSSKLSLTCLEL